MKRLLTLLLLLVAWPAHATVFHLAGCAVGASDSNDGLTATYSSGIHGPWLHPVHMNTTAAPTNAVTGLTKVGPGDTVLVHYCEYSGASSNLFFQDSVDTDAGYPASPWAVTGVPDPITGALPWINYTSASSNFAGHLGRKVSYLTISLIEFSVDRTNNPNKACFQVDGQGAEGGGTVTTHHIVLDRVNLHDCGGGGINFNYGDYFALLNSTINHVDDTVTTASGSGASWLSPHRSSSSNAAWPASQAALIAASCPSWMAGSASAFPMVLCGTGISNVSAGASASLSDGNGMTADNWGSMADRNSKDWPFCIGGVVGGCVVYPGRLLVAGNSFFFNQGPGVHIYASLPSTTARQYVIAGNRFRFNCQLVSLCGNTGARGEISGVDAADIFAVYNYVTPRTSQVAGARKTNYIATSGTFEVGCNDFYGGFSTFTAGAGAGSMTDLGGNITTDPVFSLLAPFDLRPTASSPSLGTSCAYS